jgi:hypothetical protein
MSVWKDRLRLWAALGIALATVGFIACGSDEPDTDSYLATLRGLAEQADQRDAEIFGAIESARPTALEFLGLLAEALPESIEVLGEQMSGMESLDVPGEYKNDHETLLAFLTAGIDLQQQQLTAAEARDDLASRKLQVEFGSLQRNLLADLSETFRDTVLVSEESIAAGDIFGGLDESEVAYLQTVERAFEEFWSRNAVFSQTLSQQFSDSRALLEALQDAGAGTAFEAVQNVLLPVEPPPRFAIDHAMLLRFLVAAVELDRKIGKAIDEVDPVQFVISNLQLANGDSTVRHMAALSEAVRAIAFPGSGSASAAPGPDVLADSYRSPLHFELKDFRSRFGQTGPDYLAFNIGAQDTFEVITYSARGYINTVESAIWRVRSMNPPADAAADHEIIVQYLVSTLQAHESILESAEAEDILGVNGGMLATRTAFCNAATGISDALKPAVSILFEGPPNDPDLESFCRAF